MKLRFAGLALVAAAFTTPSNVKFTQNGTGAVPRTLASKLGDVVSVCDFETTCPSASDDTAAATAAIAALPSSGGTVLFPAGVYKLNLSVIKSGVVLVGTGAGDVNTGLGGTKLTATTASSPVIQVGDGTTTVRGVRVSGMAIVGDGLNATGDGIYLLGARDVAIDNLTVTGFGRNNIFMQSSATLSTSGVYMNALTLAAARGASIRAEYGVSFVTNVSIANSHINGWSTVGSYALYLDGVSLWIANTYVDVGCNNNAAGNVTMLATANTPRMVASNVTFDNTGAATGTTLDVSTFLARSARVASAITGNYTINGSVSFSDGTVQLSGSTAGSFYQPRLLNAAAFNSLLFPLDETDLSTTTNLSRVNATGSNTEAVVLNSAGLRIPLSVTFPLEGTTNGAIWRDAISGGLRYRLDTRQPSGDHQGAMFTPVTVTTTYAATTVIDLAAGNIFNITPNNGTAFAVGNPSNGTASNTGSEIEIWIINTTGGALGAITFNASYHTAGAFTAPATTNRRMIRFRADSTGIVYYETFRSTADIPN